ncbi:MAG TPA: multifunctional oxoglutarate decarboxylase/oxoglutarate dehydrogenase thiamine pyrophosphate-binding subunit/dihydrolipoyllysine-residue succinyltransferase subunit, partial [Mycobacteriales bacterium]
MSTQGSQSSDSTSNAADFGQGGFGPNEWLVEEMYEQYLADPSSVDAAWHEFFADYRPGEQSQAINKPSRQAGAVATRTRPVQAPPAQAPATTPTPRPSEPTELTRPVAQGAARPTAMEPTRPTEPPQAPKPAQSRPQLPGRASPLRGAAA